MLSVFLIIGSFYTIGRIIQINLADLMHSLPRFEEKFWVYTDFILNWADISKEQAKEAFEAFTANLGREQLKPIGSVLQWLSGSFFSFLGNLFWVVLFVAFILSERSALARKIVSGVGPAQAIHILDVMARINKSVQQYLGLKTAVSLLTGLLVALSLALLNAPFPFLWGVLAFVLNFIPNVGSVLAGIPPIMITLFDSGSLLKTAFVAIAFVTIQVVVGNVIEPKVMGKGLDLSPLVVILSLLFWGWLWGISGMLLSVPLTAAVKIAMEQIEQTKPLAILMGSGSRY
jgi:predicted PurR-regulated permease PerM